MKRILFIFLMFIACTQLSAQAQTCRRPDFLRHGDSVAVIAPSYALNDTVTVSKAVKLLKSWGLEPMLGTNAGTKHPEYIPKKGDKRRGYHYGGGLDSRVSELSRALRDDSIKAVFCVRGGYGTIQMIERLPLSLYAANPKWIVGFSDITTLLAGQTMAGVMSIHGEMCSTFNSSEKHRLSTEKLKELLFGNIPEYSMEASEWNVPGQAEGMLVGGNLITFVSLLESDYDISSLDGTILFIEEVTESMHAVERLFHILKLHGRLPHFKGLVFGSFHKCGKELLDYGCIEEMIHGFVKELGIPVAFDFPAGHGDSNMPLVLGARVSLKVNEEGASLKFLMD